MSQRDERINVCDVCGHDWIPREGIVYTHCTSSKCRSRRWDKTRGSSVVEQDAHNDGLGRNVLVAGSNPAPATKEAEGKSFSKAVLDASIAMMARDSSKYFLTGFTLPNDPSNPAALPPMFHRKRR